MKLLIVVPAYNEEETISSLLHQVLSVDLKRIGLEKQILVVDDGSTDNTAQIVKENFPEVVLLSNESRQGKGSALRKGFGYCQADFVLIQDADLEYDPQDYFALLRPLIQQKAEVVYGSRFLSQRYPKGLRFINYIGNILGTLIANFLYRARLTDIMTCYKVFSQRLLESLVLCSRGFDICAEITAKILKRGIKIYEVPISYHGRSHQQGKKIAFIDGIFIFLALCKYRFRD